MPSKHWHYIRYMSVGIGMAFRSLADIHNLVNAAWQMGIISQVDDGMRQLTGEWWFKKKHEWALKNARKQLKQESKDKKQSSI